jgi:hypothetical protein
MSMRVANAHRRGRQKGRRCDDAARRAPEKRHNAPNQDAGISGKCWQIVVNKYLNLRGGNAQVIGNFA